MKLLAKLSTVLAPTLAIAALLAAPAAAAEFEKYGIESFSAETTTSQAGAHPDVKMTFKLKQDPLGESAFDLHEPYASTKNLRFALPAGLLGNLNAVDHCEVDQFLNALQKGGCPLSSQVGFAKSRVMPFGFAVSDAIYLLEAPTESDVVARLGLWAGPFTVVINVRARSDSDYGLTSSIEGVPSQFTLISSEATLWGVPGDHSHDNRRLLPPDFKSSLSPPREFGRPPEPFFTNPTTCAGPLTFGFSANSYQLPDQISTMQATMTDKAGVAAPITGCDALDFQPSFEATPTTHAAGAPTGLDATLKIPQDETPEGLATSQLRDARVTFPRGMTINPDAGNGLEACSAQQVGYKELHKAECPLASTLGTATFDVPALQEPIEGAVYQRTPEPGHLFRIWLAADEQGAHVALPGEIELDPATGQISSAFLDNPQVPLRELQLHLKVGPRAPLTNPDSCGTYATHFDFTPWSGTPPVPGDAPMSIDEGCAGRGGFAPKLDAGSTNLNAGAYTGVVVNVVRQDGEQNVSGLDLTIPKGLTAKLAGVALCGEAQAATGNCPASSQVGTTTVSAGPGIAPLVVPQPGKAATAVYLAGPYKSAPYSFVVKVPAQAGPFDLGTVATRVALQIDPETTQVTAKSDPLPQLLQGVPIAYRQIHVELNRANFAINPTGCEAKTVSAHITSPGGATADPSNPFQVGECGALGFKPKLDLRLQGGTKRHSFPAFKATLTYPSKGAYANIAKAQVTLPHSAFLEQSHIGTVCTRVQFAASSCPKRSIYGRARAVTPLLDKPLEGPVYLRSSSHPLPDLVADLNGQIHVVLVGTIDTGKGGGIRNTFEAVPDAPVSKFTLELAGGKKGLLVNSENLCGPRAKTKAVADFTAQNGRVSETEPVLANSCAKQGRKGKGKKHGARR